MTGRIPPHGENFTRKSTSYQSSVRQQGLRA